jgi:hypothetical protein
MNAYPKDSELYLTVCVDDSVKRESELIGMCKGVFTHRKDIGNEYFEGDVFEMMNMIYGLSRAKQPTEPTTSMASVTSAAPEPRVCEYIEPKEVTVPYYEPYLEPIAYTPVVPEYQELDSGSDVNDVLLDSVVRQWDELKGLLIQSRLMNCMEIKEDIFKHKRKDLSWYIALEKNITSATSYEVLNFAGATCMYDLSVGMDLLERHARDIAMRYHELDIIVLQKLMTKLKDYRQLVEYGRALDHIEYNQDAVDYITCKLFLREYDIEAPDDVLHDLQSSLLSNIIALRESFPEYLRFQHNEICSIFKYRHVNGRKYVYVLNVNRESLVSALTHGKLDAFVRHQKCANVSGLFQTRYDVYHNIHDIFTDRFVDRLTKVMGFTQMDHKLNNTTRAYAPIIDHDVCEPLTNGTKILIISSCNNLINGNLFGFTLPGKPEQLHIIAREIGAKEKPETVILTYEKRTGLAKFTHRSTHACISKRAFADFQ